MSFLLDTNVISKLRKGKRADGSATAWYADQLDEHIFLGVLTIDEIRRGAENIGRRDLAWGSALMTWMDRIVDAHADRIIGIDREVAEEWGV